MCLEGPGGEVIFSPFVLPTLEDRGYTRYQKLASARRMAMGGSRLPDEVRGAITRLKAEGFTVSEVSEKIIDAYGKRVLRSTQAMGGETRGEGGTKQLFRWRRSESSLQSRRVVERLL